MNKLLLTMALSGAALGVFAGCSSPLGGPKIDNTTGTTANQIEVRNIEAYSNPTPQGR